MFIITFIIQQLKALYFSDSGNRNTLIQITSKTITNTLQLENDL